MNPVHLKQKARRRNRRALLFLNAKSGRPLDKSVLRVVVVFGELLDLVDQRFGAMAKLVFRIFVDGLVVECGIIQHRLDLAGQFVAILGDLADPLQVAGIDLVGAGDGAVRPDQAGAAEFALRRVELLEDLSEFREVLAASRIPSGSA